MICYTAEIIKMVNDGYRPHSHGEWIDTHFENFKEHIWGAALGCTTMNSNQRFVVVEL